MMRFTYLLLFLLLAGSAYAQPNTSCTPTTAIATGPAIAGVLWTPDNGLPDATSNVYYEEALSFVLANDTTVFGATILQFDITVIDSITGLPCRVVVRSGKRPRG